MPDENWRQPERELYKDILCCWIQMRYVKLIELKFNYTGEKN